MYTMCVCVYIYLSMYIYIYIYIYIHMYLWPTLRTIASRPAAEPANIADSKKESEDLGARHEPILKVEG